MKLFNICPIPDISPAWYIRLSWLVDRISVYASLHPWNLLRSGGKLHGRGLTVSHFYFLSRTLSTFLMSQVLTVSRLKQERKKQFKQRQYIYMPIRSSTSSVSAKSEFGRLGSGKFELLLCSIMILKYITQEVFRSNPDLESQFGPF